MSRDDKPALDVGREPRSLLRNLNERDNARASGDRLAVAVFAALDHLRPRGNVGVATQQIIAALRRYQQDEDWMGPACRWVEGPR